MSDHLILWYRENKRCTDCQDQTKIIKNQTINFLKQLLIKMQKYTKQKLLNLSALIEQWIKITYQINLCLMCPDIVQYTIFALSILQPFYFMNESEQNNAQYLMKILVRPDLILQEYGDFIKNAYVILLLIQLLQKTIFFVITLIVLKFQISVQNQLSHGILIYIIQPLIYYQTFLKLYLLLPISQVFFKTFFESLNEAQQGNQQFFAKMLLSVLGESLYFFDVVYFMKILNHPISYKIQKWQQFQIQNIDYLILKLNLIQVIIAQLPNTKIQSQFQTASVFLLSLVSIVNQLLNTGYIYGGQKIIFFTFQSYVLLTALLNFFLENGNDQKNLLATFFILFPIIIFLCLKVQEQIDDDNFKSLFLRKQHKISQKSKSHNTNKIMYQLVRVLNNCDSNKQYLNFKVSLIFHQHKRKCEKQQCSCHLDYNITECSQINGVTSQMVAKFMQGQYKQLVKFLFINKMKNSMKQDLLIQIGILLHDFNQMMISLQILSLLKKSKENSIFNVSFLYKFMNQKDNKMNEETKIRIQLSIIEQVQINLVLIQSRLKFEANLGTSLKAATQSLIKQYLNEFLISQTNQSLMFEGMSQCVKKKIEFYEMLDSDSGFSITQLFEQIKQTSKVLIKVEKQFQTLFQQMPDLQFQRLYCFFQSQIMNNLLKAFLIKQTDLNVKDHQLKYRAIKDLNLSAELKTYLILSVDENFRTLHIEQAAQTFGKFFGQSFDPSTNTFMDIVPLYYNKIHENSVQIFFQTGQNKFYRNFNFTFLRQFNGLLKQVTLCIDNTSYLKIDKFIFACLLQSVNQELPFLVVDQKSQLTYFTTSSLLALGLNQSFIKKHIEEGVLHNISISTIIPYFNLFLKENLQDSQIFTTFCFFLKPQYNTDISLTVSTFKKDSNFFIWKNKENINCFSVELKIEKINLQETSYFLLELINVRLLATHEERKKVLDLFKPCIGESSIYKSSKWKGKHLKIMSVLSFRKEKKRTTLKLEQTLKKSGNQNENSMNKQLNQSSFIQQDRSHTNLLSCKTRNEQEFYKSFNKSFVESEVVNSPQEKEAKVKENQNQNTIDITKQDVKPAQAERIPPQQLSSSVAGGYRPFFYNKFALLERMTEKKSPKKIDFFLFFFIGQSMIFFIFSIIVMVNMTSDISYISNNIEMCSLHASIMGPHDLFFSMRATVSSYQQMYREGFLTLAQVQNLTEPYYLHIDSGYQELKDSLYNQLGNSYLQEFFTDNNIDLRFMSENETQLKQTTTSFRESLMVILQYQYAYMRVIQQRQSTSGKPCQIFLMANYFLFHDKTEELTVQIYNWLIETKNLINQRGIIFWILLQILLVLFGLIGLYNFNLYIRYYDQFLLIFNEFNKKQIYDQLNKFDSIDQKLQLYSEEILKYNLDQELHEQETTQSQYGRGKTHHFKLLNRNRQQISRSKVYTIILIITIFYLTYTSSIYYKQNVFMSKYEDTIQLYKLIQDLKLKSGSVYLYREIFLRWDNFTFLTQNDRTTLYGYLDSSFRLMDKYILLSSSYKEEDYLVEGDFSNAFIEIQNNDICNQIQDYLEEFMLFYCNKSFEGTLLNGLTQSLSYISNSIKTQEQINGFTKRVEVQLYEQEGSQVITRTFFKLSDLFLESMKKVSQQMNDFLVYFSLTYMLVSALLIFIIQQQYRNFLIDEYHSIRQSLYLIPKDSILYDESLERYLREVGLHQALI